MSRGAPSTADRLLAVLAFALVALVLPAGAQGADVPTDIVPASGPRTLAVVQVNFADVVAPDVPAADVQSAVHDSPLGLRAFYDAMSGGMLQVTDPVLLGTVTIPDSTADCTAEQYSTRPWRTDAREQLAIRGVDLHQYTDWLFLIPDNRCTNGNAVGSHRGCDHGSCYGWIVGPVTRLDGGMLGHEFGHVLGSDHANTRTCPSTMSGTIVRSDPTAPTCSELEYGDPTHVMGYSGPSLKPIHAGEWDAFRRYAAGWFTDRDVLAAGPATTEPVLAPIERASTAIPRALRIPRSVGGALSAGSLWLEFRRPERFDSDASWLDGVLVRYQSAGNVEPRLMPASATTDTRWGLDDRGDAQLTSGAGFYDSQARVLVYVRAVTTDTATIDLRYGDDAQRAVDAVPVITSSGRRCPCTIGASIPPPVQLVSIRLRVGPRSITGGARIRVPRGLSRGKARACTITATDSAGRTSTRRCTVGNGQLRLRALHSTSRRR